MPAVGALATLAGVLVRIILNPNAGTADQRQWIEPLRSLGEVTVCETGQKGDAGRWAQAAVAEGIDLVVAAGGDGTIQEVIGGLLQGQADAMRLAIIPLGTGNDFARTLAIPEDPLEAGKVVAAGRERRIDAMRLIAAGRTHYGVNVAAGGFTGQMNEAMTDEIKSAWGPLAYLRGALAVLPDLTAYETRVRVDGETQWRQTAAYNIIVANGRTAGGGMVVAPHANPEDGLLDVVTVHQGSVVDLTGVAARLLAGDYTTSDVVSHQRVRRIAIESTPGMWFNLDGELLGNDPVEIEVMPGALRVLVGPAYQPEPVV